MRHGPCLTLRSPSATSSWPASDAASSDPRSNRRRAVAIAQPRARFRRDGTNAIGIDLALPIVVGCCHEPDVGALGQAADGFIRRRGPAASGADIKRVGAQDLDRGEAHGIDRRLGDADPLGLGRPEAKQLLGAARGEAAPFRSTLLPARERSSRIAMRRPHAALGTLSQPTAGDRLLHDVGRQRALVGQIAPGSASRGAA